MNSSFRAVALGVTALVIAACGGGGGGDTPPAVASPSPPPSLPAAPPANRPPLLVQRNANRTAVDLHPFSYDVLQGTTFSDPDGDPLVYSVTMSQPLDGLHVSGTTVSGTPTLSGGVYATTTISITASDGHSSSSTDSFAIDVVRNSAPTVARSNLALLVRPGDHVNYDPTRGGTTFVDADGDRLSYELRATFTPPELRVEGLHVVGAPDKVGLATFEIEASDGYGGSTVDRFSVAAVAPEPGAPRLPVTSYDYADADLPLPLDFRNSSDGFAPFWDTTLASGNLPTNAGATLGRVLFYDKRLSITNTHACASCHHQDRNFAAPERFSSGAQGIPLTRHAMALTNARYNFRGDYFIDQRVRGLENLITMPIEAPAELGNPMPLLVEKIAATSFYPPLFEAAFGTPEVTSERVVKALVQFVRSMISFRSRFDRAYHRMTVNDTADPAAVLSPQEMRGADLFHGAPGAPLPCVACHETGVQLMDSPTNNGLDKILVDPGGPFGAFRAPSLRNIAASAPYMHDGRFATLRAVIDHYDHGIQDSVQLSSKLRNGDGSVVRMGLSDADKDALEAFLRTFTDEDFLHDPKFSDPFP